MSINKVLLIGRLGQDPELKHTPSGTAVANFSIATSEKWTDKNGQSNEKTEWHKVIVWGKLAELCNQYLTKGRQAFVEGKIQTRSWEDQQGVKRYTTEIIASTIQFLGSSSNSSQSNHQEETNPAYNPDIGSGDFTADDIPF